MTVAQREAIERLINKGYPMLQVAEMLNINPDLVEQIMEEYEDDVVWSECTM